MHYVYVLKSKKSKDLYIGCTNDLKRRLKQHNAKSSGYVGLRIPWEVRYYEAFYSKEDAFEREKRLKKNWRGLQELKKRIRNSIK